MSFNPTLSYYAMLGIKLNIHSTPCAGDFVAAVKLFKDVGVAIKDHGGASDDYQRVVEELESINAVLIQVQSLKSSTDNFDFINAIRGQAQFSQNTITKFLNRIAKYDHVLGKSGKKGCQRGIVSKAKWAIYTSKEIDKLRKVIQSQSLTIQTLFATFGLESLSHMRHDQTDAQKWIASDNMQTQNVLFNVRQSIHDLQASSGQAARDAQAAFSANRDESRLHLAGVQQTILSQISDGNLGLINNIDSINDRLVQLQNSIPSLLTAAVQQARAPPPISNNLAASREISDLRATLETLSCPQWQSPLARGTLQMSVVPSQVTTTQALALLFQLFTSGLSKILGKVLRGLHHFFQVILLLFPQLAVYFRVLRSIPRSASLLLRDNIEFEDVLGRIHSLQFEQFRHWRVFKSLLLCTFENVPGRDKVRKGQYSLVNAKVQGQILNAANWNQLVRPRAEIIMFVKMVATESVLGSCPRCSAVVDKADKGQSQCGGCGLTYSCCSGLENTTKTTTHHKERSHRGVEAGSVADQSQQRENQWTRQRDSNSESPKRDDRLSPSKNPQSYSSDFTRRQYSPQGRYSLRHRKRQAVESSSKRRMETRLEAAEKDRMLEAKARAANLEIQERLDMRFFKRIETVVVRKKRSIDVQINQSKSQPHTARDLDVSSGSRSQINQGRSYSRTARDLDISPRSRSPDLIIEYNNGRHVTRQYPYFARDEKSQKMVFDCFRTECVRIR